MSNEYFFVPVKKAYRKLSLQIHPDRNNQDEKHIANEKFGILSKIYHILIDPKAKALYDEKGIVSESVTNESDSDVGSRSPNAMNMQMVKNHYVGNS